MEWVIVRIFIWNRSTTKYTVYQLRQYLASIEAEITDALTVHLSSLLDRG